MNPLFTIDIENVDLSYTFFYFIAFLAGFIILVLEGRKRKFPTIPWLLVIITCFLFFIFGTQAIRFSSEDWMRVLRLQPVDHAVGRSVLGGVLFAIPSLFIAKYILKFRFSVMDAFAWAAPVGMLIQRVGCLIAGCCYGTPTTMPWGIQYGADSYAFLQHLNDGLIPGTAHTSLTIHPIAIYEIVGCIIVLIVLRYWNKRIKASGNLFFSSIGLYLVVRFVTEFFRAGAINNFGPTGLTLVQVIVVHVAIILLIIITQRELNWRMKSEVWHATSSNKMILLYGVSISIILLFSSQMMNQIEIISVSVALIPTLIFIGWRLFKAVTVPRLRLTTSSLLIGSLLVMSQTLPEGISSDSNKRSYHVLSIGMLSGSSDFHIERSDCNSSQSADVHDSFKVSGAGYTRVEEKETGVLQYGINAYWGSHDETIKILTPSAYSRNSSTPIVGLNPYFQYDWKIMGMGLGFHAGSLTTFKSPEYDPSAPLTYLNKTSAFPSAYFRVGYVNKVFGEVKLSQQFPTAFPSATLQTNIGFGFGKNNGGAIRLGTASHTGIFVAPIIPIGKHIILESYLGGLPGFIYSATDSNSDFDEQKNNFVGSVSLRYKFGNRYR